MRTRKIIRVFQSTMFAVGLGVSGVNQAAVVTYVGEDLGFGPPNQVPRLSAFPNAVDAQASFLSQLNNVRVEDFESTPQGGVAPLPIDFGLAGTATLSGGGVVDNMPSGTFFGVYPTSGNQYWRFTEISASAFTLDFSQPQVAFGFFASDVGDFNAQLTLSLESTLGNTSTLVIPHSAPSPSGSVIFFGAIDVDNPFVSVTFGSTVAAEIDGFGFDDFTIGTASNVIPLPASFILFSSGLFGLIGLQRLIPKRGI